MKAKARALGLLARREYSRAELERRLLRDAAPDDQAARREVIQALDELAASGLQSDARAAEMLVAGRAARFGVRRLEQDLRTRGLSTQVAFASLDAARGTELERARALWRRRFGAPAVDLKERARQARFLAARGFAADVVRAVVRGLDDEGS